MYIIKFTHKDQVLYNKTDDDGDSDVYTPEFATRYTYAEANSKIDEYGDDVVWRIERVYISNMSIEDCVVDLCTL